MNALEEAHDLRENPLPVLICNPLERVWILDGQITKLTEELHELMWRRQEALDYAVKEQIAEDENYRLERKAGRILRAINPQRFREVFPQEYDMICSIERKEKMDALDHIGEKIPVTLADKLVKKVVLNAAQGVVTAKESPATYSVVRK